MIFEMRIQLEEAKWIYEVTKSDLESKEEYQKMEEENVNLKKELEK